MPVGRRPGSLSESARNFALLTGVAVLVVAIFLPVPVAGAFWLTCAIGGASWPRPELALPDSPQEKFARFARKLSRGLLLPTRAVLGFGDPGTARGHERSRRPRARLSAWAAVMGGVLAATLDLLIASRIPSHRPVTALGSFIFGFLLCQGLAYAARETAHEDEVGPPVLVERDTAREELAKLKLPLLVVTAATFAGSLFCFAVVLGEPVALAAWVAVVLTVSAAGGLWARRYAQTALAEWKNEVQERAEWEQRWAAVPRAGNNPPTWVTQHHLPREAPTHVAATFAIPAGANFSLYEEAAERLGPALGSDMILISPMPAIDEMGRPIPGSAQYSGFTVTWALNPMGTHPHLQPDLDQMTHKFAIRWALTRAFKSLGLGRPELAALRRLTAPGADNGCLVESEWRLDPSVTFDKVASKATALQEKIGAPWLRVGRRVKPDGQAQEFVSVVFGDEPSTVKLRPRDAANLRTWIDQLDWAAWFRGSKLVGTNGSPPRLLARWVNDKGIAEMEFGVTDGLSLAAIKKGIGDLRATSGHGYIAIEPLDDASRFRMVAGLKDPLNDLYLFMDYESTVLTQAQRGDPRIDWYVGIGADGEPIMYRWYGEDLPHLLLAGGSGSGKSGIINSMVCQMAHNCHPDDLEFWMMDPKNELVAYVDIAHVKRFVDGQTAGNPYENAALMLEEGVVEMHRRYSAMTTHPLRPQKIGEARLIAKREGPGPNGERHSLDFPYLVILLEEVSSILSRPPLKQDIPFWERVIARIEELARLARAAGVILVVCTQYPTNPALGNSQILKQQCRRLGLMVNNQVASQVIIDEPGLEEINVSGRGLISWTKGFRGFRGFLMRKPSEENADVPDDRAELIARLPTGGARVFTHPASPAVSSALPKPPPGIWESAS